jgi:hypothetical protein
MNMLSWRPARGVLALLLFFYPSLTFGAEVCISGGTFLSKARVFLSQDNQINESEVTFSATLFTRTLLAEEESSWVGYQFQNAGLQENDQIASPIFYTVPFAVRINRETGVFEEVVVNAPLKGEDEARLLALYDLLHSLPSELLDAQSPVVVRERDRVGVVETHYLSPRLGEVVRQRQAYVSLGGSREGDGLLEAVELEEDRTEFREQACGFRELKGTARVTARFNGGLTVLTQQQHETSLGSQPVPDQLRLALLPPDPRTWPPLTVADVYPRPVRRPLASAELFLEQLNRLGAVEIFDGEALKRLLFDNDDFLESLRPALANSGFSSDFEQELLLRLGQANSTNARGLLTSLITDDAVNPKTRFGSLMGMNLNEVDQQLADSTLLVLGTVSGSTRDRGLERRLADRLMSAGDESSALVALSALGNSGSESSGQLIGRYLSDPSPSLRRRAAESLGQIPGDAAKLVLAEHLSAERQPQVLGAMIESFGRRPLAREDLPPLIEKAVPSEPLVVRRAAISALAGQVPHLPEASSALRQIMTQTTDRQSLETIMGALYSGD